MTQPLARNLFRNCLLAGALVLGFLAVAYGSGLTQQLFALPAGNGDAAARRSHPVVTEITNIHWSRDTGVSDESVSVGDRKSNLAASESIAAARHLSNAFRSVSQQVLPSVVSIENRPKPVPIKSRPSSPQQRPIPPGVNPFQGTPFEDLFKDGPPQRQFGFRAQPRMPREPRAGAGSGVIVDAAGLILTNHHVVRGDGEIIVRLQDGREFKADRLWMDPKTDIAVVQISGADHLVPAKIGDSEQVFVGDWVLALGQPFGLESTVTAGIISGKGRAMGITEREDFIQTDAAINPGNSGGPLVNLDGEVIGINTAISSRGGGNDGVGFAVPINLAKWVADELVDDGIVERAFLGVGIQTMTQTLADQFNVNPRSGLLITQVQPDSPAARAGLKTGDILVEFDGRKVSTPNHLQTIVERSDVGGSYPLVVIRDGQPMELSVVVAALPTDPKEVSQQQHSLPESPESMSELGMSVDAIDSEIGRRLNVTASHGVVVTGVQRGGPAGRAGLQMGMVITEVNRVEIHSVDEFMRQVTAVDLSDGILLRVEHKNGARYIVMGAAQ